MSETEFRTGVIRPVECFKEGWELIKSQYWLLFAVTLTGAVIGGVSMYVLIGAMICGIFLCYFQAIDGEPVNFELLFKGFSYFVPSLLLVFVIIVPTVILLMVVYAPFIAAAVMGSKLSPDEFFGLLVGSLVLDFIVVILMVCFHTLLMFAFPLLVDRNLSAVRAIKTSIKAVWKNLGGVAGIAGVGFLLSLLGTLACGVGTYFVIPIILAGNIVAYRKVFPKLRNNYQTPPPPNAYSDAGRYN
jgi:hypothetical protein